MVSDESDEELSAGIESRIEEQMRRSRLVQAPIDIAASAKRFVEDGGDPEEIRQALTDLP